MTSTSHATASAYSDAPCACRYLRFTYYEEHRTNRRAYFVLVFDGRPPQLGLASADFALEMRAVSMLQHHPRRRHLPLRLLQWVTYSGSEEPLRLQPPSDRLPEDKRDIVVRHLIEYALAWGVWRRGELSPPGVPRSPTLAAHELGPRPGEGVTIRTSYPNLIKALRVPQYWEQDCLDLGTARNRVKHRGLRHEAERYVEMYEQCVYSVAYEVTGIDAMPRSAYKLRWEEAGERLLPPLMYDTWGNPKRFTRY